MGRILPKFEQRTLYCKVNARGCSAAANARGVARPLLRSLIRERQLIDPECESLATPPLELA